ncbi:hypothetical protein XA68_15245 [Ophiocordyceps unilateralis]|uniref:C2H2-type domain-containing protein n=1 Tax=Ophiocordyceps unilateralis TaxID=268505 RepID=A0A2A9P8N8_OPHUN|nr:hypothetical protein XA68_15245 [Ophiocordyceps unilateralis]
MSKRNADGEASGASPCKRPQVDLGLRIYTTDCVDADDDTAASSPDSTANGETPATAATTPRGKFPSDLKTLACTWPGCSKTFNRPARLRDHLNSHSDYRPFKCSYDGCDKNYVVSKHLKQHVKAAHTQELKYLCPRPDCGKSFVTGTRLRRHQAVHEGADRFRCADCGQSFRKKETLHKHVRKEHLHMPAHECPDAECTEAFDTKPSMRRHFQKVHGEIRFWCGECAPSTADDGTVHRVGFTTQAQLDGHLKREHQDCIFCDYKSATRWELERHIEANHSGKSVEERRVHECTIDGCGKKFTNTSNLHVHIRSAHLGVRFVCGQVELSGPRFEGWSNDLGCGDHFVSKARLEDHVCFIHLGHLRPKLSLLEPRADEADFVQDLCGAAYDAKRDIACPRCRERFVRYHDLNIHLSSDHDDDQRDETNLFNLLMQPEAPLLVDPSFEQTHVQPGPADDTTQDDGIFAAQMEYGPPVDDWAIDEAAMLLLTRDPPGLDLAG